MPRRMHDNEVDVDDDLVRCLLRRQLPAHADQPLVAVEPWGTDHAIWRLGSELVVRLPRIEWAAGQPEKEARWLPRLAPHLDVAVPHPVMIGEPGCGYPFNWAVHRWIHGRGAAPESIDDPVQFARDLAANLRSLQRAPVDGAPRPTNRARALKDYDARTRRVIERAGHRIDADAALLVWQDALEAPVYDGPPVWVQGDLEGNCLVRERRLCGIVDWGSACIGDPAVDVQVVWSSLFTAESRRAFIDELDVDDATLRRSRGAAINQACAALPYYEHTYPLMVERSWHKLTQLGVGSRREAQS
jgi:aminoglycoside phosphotransferase (APT) family kinase protein